MGDEWVTVPEAAKVAGISERAMWRWVKADTVESRMAYTGRKQLRQVRRGSIPLPTDTADGSISSVPIHRHALPMRANERALLQLAADTQTLREQLAGLVDVPAAVDRLAAALDRIEAEQRALREELARSRARRWWQVWRKRS
jgi:hypothetical protein